MARQIATCLSLLALTSSGFLLPRQDDADTTTFPPTVPTPPSLPLSDTDSESATSTASFSAPSPESSLDVTDDPNGCHKTVTLASSPNIFCKPNDGQELDYDDAYILQWDVSNQPYHRLFNPPTGESPTASIVEDGDLRLQIFRTSYLEDQAQSDSTSARDQKALLTLHNVTQWKGRTTFNTSKSWLERDSKPANLTILLNYAYDGSLGTSRSNLPRNGPSILLLNRRGAGVPSSSSSSSNDLGAKIGPAVAIIVILVLLGLITFFWIRRRRSMGRPLLPTFGGRLGGTNHLGGKSDYMRKRRSTGPSIGDNGADGLVGPYAGVVGRRGHTREASISMHDGPPRVWADGRGAAQDKDVELEERKSAASNDWGWGGSPTGPHTFASPTQNSPPDAGGNAFREEIGRQKTGRGY